MIDPNRPLRIVIACGGTGGHLFPGIAVAQVLWGRGHDSLLLISEKQVDATAALDHPDLEFKSIPAVGLPALCSPRVFSFAWKFWRTCRLTRAIVRDFRADAVLGMGGFTSLPPALAGRRLRARTFIHESNAIPGKANRLTARFSDVVLLGLPECASHFPGKRTHVVGTPLRAAMRDPVDREAAFRAFSLDPSRRTLLVMGGSQGARGVNRAVIAALPHLDPSAHQLLWLTGHEDEEEARDALADSPLPGFIAPFYAHLEKAYAIADLCIARSGGSSLAELAHFGIATILIPLPTAAEDHQTKNALAFSKHDAAILLTQSDAAHSLGPLIRDLFADDTRRLALASRLRALGVSNAAQKVADVVEDVTRGDSGP